MKLCELHTHLYGCLSLEDLRWLATRRPPRWQIYENSYRQLYGKRAPVRLLLQNQDLLERHYYYLSCSGFRAFQVHFDLIIALSHTDPEEIGEICLRVAARELADHAEYRMLFPLGESDQSFLEKSHAFCEALSLAEKENSGKRFRAVISLHRQGELAWRQYHLLRGLMKRQTAAASHLVGVDFCGQEEQHPPWKKRALFQQILEDNRNDPQQALAILYHVGESFGDKSLESAVRWVVQSAQFGAHRLGHAVALGIDPRYLQGTARQESAAERIDQILFEKEHAASLRESGYPVDLHLLEREERYLNERIAAEGERAKTAVAYSPKRTKALLALQSWAINSVRQSGAIVECCPTSNIRICRLGRGKAHPLARFISQRLPVVIGADDPGILNTDLAKELQMISHWAGVGPSHVQQMIERAWACRSERLSGRPQVARQKY